MSWAFSFYCTSRSISRVRTLKEHISSSTNELSVCSKEQLNKGQVSWLPSSKCQMSPHKHACNPVVLQYDTKDFWKVPKATNAQKSCWKIYLFVLLRCLLSRRLMWRSRFLGTSLKQANLHPTCQVYGRNMVLTCSNIPWGQAQRDHLVFPAKHASKHTWFAKNYIYLRNMHCQDNSAL